MSSIEIVRVPILSDNYVWIVGDLDSSTAMVVDPGVAAPVLAEAKQRGWTITDIWTTHWHPDHTGGNAEIKAETGCTVSGPLGEAAKIPTLDRTVAAGDIVRFGSLEARVLEVPGHTAGHIAYHIADQQLIFVGDTLFAMGCGRLFEGTAEQMFANMQQLKALPDATMVYCAHEYTLANGRYALVAEPDNIAIRDRMQEVERLRADDRATVPTTIGLERATNPFLRAEDAAQLAERRAAKDSFRS